MPGKLRAQRPLDVAIVGMAGRFPGADSTRAFWENLLAGVESIARLSDDALRASGVSQVDLDNPQYVKASGTLQRYDAFDSGFFGVNPREADVMDPQHRLFLECAWEALEDAGYGSPAYRPRIGIFAGTGLNGYWLALQQHPDLLSALGMHVLRLTNDKDFLASRVAYKLDLRGPAVVVQTACSTSLAAVHLACASLMRGECDMALAGASAILTYGAGYHYQEGGIYAPDGHCRAFDAAAKGTVPGDGAGVVLLKSLADATRDGDHVYAVIKGSAMNNDGADKLGYAAPSVGGQVEVIRQARAMAGRVDVSPDYVEAHGTGTELGDLVEVAALTEAFAADGATGPTRIGSVKSNIGHLDAAAGIAGLIKTALAIKHGWLPPTLHVEQPNPRIAFDRGPFVPITSLMRWDKRRRPRRADVSSFGIGGTNVHLVLEERREPRARTADTDRPELLTLSAPTVEGLSAVRASLAAYLRANLSLSLSDVAYTLRVGRQTFAYRKAIVCRDTAEAIAALEAPDGAHWVSSPERNDGESIAFLFPGQGTQDGDLGAELYAREPSFRAHLDQCARILRPLIGGDLREVVLRRAASGAAQAMDLQQTSTTQLALFAVESSLAATWQQWGVRPAIMLGHSVGEYTAAYLAGVFSLEDALTVLVARGRLLDALPSGAMTAVLLSEDELQPWLTADLSLAATNAPRQCVVSGPVTAVARFERDMAVAGITTTRLQTNRAFHSAMVDPVMNRFADAFRSVALHPPAVPFISSVTGEEIREAEACDPLYWVRHLRETVRFDRALRQLALEPGRVLLEVGPGRTLTRLARRVSDIEVSTVASLHTDVGVTGEGALLQAAGRLWMAGVAPNWNVAHRHGLARRVPLPTYPFVRTRHWVSRSAAGTSGPVRTPAAASVEQPDSLVPRFYVPRWTLSTGAAGLPERRRILLFDDGTELGQALASAWRAAGHQIVSVKTAAEFSSPQPGCFHMDPDAPGDYRTLSRHVGRCDEIVHLWNTMPSATEDDEADTRCFARALALAQAAVDAAAHQPLRLTIVGRQLARVTPGDEVRPDRAAVLGICRVLPQEHPSMSCRAIDIGPERSGAAQERLVAALAAECLSAAGDRVVGLRGSSRWVEDYQPLALDDRAAASSPFKMGGHYLIVGGLSRIGSALASWLATRFRARVVVTTRVHPSADAVSSIVGDAADARRRARAADAIRRLAHDGGAVSIVVADPACEGDMRAVVESATASGGRLDGAIYAAGFVSSGMVCALADMDVGHYERHFRAKARGVRVLEAVTADLDLDFCMVTSSLASVLGGLGYAAYAAANLFADAVAARNRRTSTPWLSFNWDGWRFDETDRAERIEDVAVAALSADEGVRAFGLVASAVDIGQVIVSATDLAPRLARWAGPSTTLDVPTDAGPGQDDAPVSIEDAIAGEWRRALGVERIGVDDTFFALGGDSLLATHVVAAIRRRFGVNLALRDFFERPTIAAVAEAVRLGTASPARDDAPTFAAASGGATSMEALVKEVAATSDEAAEMEVRRLRAKPQMGASV